LNEVWETTPSNVNDDLRLCAWRNDRNNETTDVHATSDDDLARVVTCGASEQSNEKNRFDSFIRLDEKKRPLGSS
jgi:hypothetical protein